MEQFVAEPRIAQRLSQIGAPVLAVAGDVPPESYPGQVHAALDRGIRNVTAVKMPGAGHFPNLEQPDEFHRLVTEFLTRAPATAR